MKKEEKIRAYTYALDNINREIADDVPSNGICWYLNLYAIAINENSGHYESFFKTYPELLKYAPNDYIHASSRLWFPTNNEGKLMRKTILTEILNQLSQ